MERISLTECRRIVGDVRSVLRSAAHTLTPEMQKAAREYAEACRLVNQRLRRCQDLLNHGLEGEALHLCQTSPDLLDLVAALNFPQRQAWDELTARYGLPLTPALETAAARALNTAVEDHAPVAPLLRRLRLLALLRAPVIPRLALLRDIGRHDPRNPFWADEIRRHEQYRLEELPAEILAARRARDEGRLVALQQELDSPVWLTPPPPAVAAACRRALDKGRARADRKRLEDLLARFRSAQGRNDAAAGHALREQVRQVLRGGHIPPGAALVASFRPLFEWLAQSEEEEKRDRAFQQALRELADEIAGGTRLQALKDKMERAQAFRRPVPPHLEGDYQARVRRLQRAARSRVRTLAVGSVAAVVVFVLLAGYVVSRARDGRAFDEHVRRVEELLTNGAPKEGELKGYVPPEDLRRLRMEFDELGRQRPDFLNRPRMAELRQQYEEAAARETRRAAARDRALADREWDRARRLSFPGEYDQVRARQEAQQIVSREEQGREEREFRELLEELTRSLKGVQHHVRAEDLPKAQAALDAVRKGEAALKATADKVGLGPRADLQRFERELAAVAGELARLGAEARFREEFVKLLATSAEADTFPAAYAALLQKYLDAHPDGRRAGGFERARKERAHWETFGRWQQELAKWKGDVFPESAAELAKRKDWADEFLRANAGFRAAAAYRYKLGDLAGALGGIDAALKRPAVRNVVQVRRRAESYYVPREAWNKFDRNRSAFFAVNPAGRFFMPALSNAGGELTKLALGPGEVAVLAPQSELAEEWFKKRPSTLSEFERAVAGLGARVQAYPNAVRDLKKPELDPILQKELLTDLLRHAVKGSPWLAPSLDTQVLEPLKAIAVKPGANWVWPFDANGELDPELPKVREEVRQALAKVPPLNAKEAVGAAAAARQEASRQAAVPQAKPAGFLWKSEGGWKILGPGENAADATLYTLDTNLGRLVEVGEVSRGTVIPRFGPGAEGTLYDGSLVFASPKASAK